VLEPIARETYGILIYQSRCMQAAQVLRCSRSSADLLRRAMGKKKREKWPSNAPFSSRAARRKNQIPDKKANEIFVLLEKLFAATVSTNPTPPPIAIVAYQTAYPEGELPGRILLRDDEPTTWRTPPS